MTKQKNQTFQPLDQTAIILMVLLSCAIAILLWQGDHSSPRVRDFSWKNQIVGAEDRGFVLTFSRPMNRASVQENITINPPLPEVGKFSWAGRRMAYTLNTPAPYGAEFQVELKNAKDKFATANQTERKIEPFIAKFKTRDRAFAYLGIEGTEAGRLMLVNASKKQAPIALSPPELVVTDFKPYPNGDRILFSANDRNFQRQGPQALLEQKLYSVTTGIDFSQAPNTSRAKIEPAGKVKPILDNRDYRNLQFDLAADGKTIVVQRTNRRNPADFGLWIIKSDAKPTPLKGQPGGDFLITPDSTAIAISQGEGLSILPLATTADQPLDFLPKFGNVVAFSSDGTAAAMVKHNSGYTRSLFLVTNEGEKELFRTSGSVLDAQFHPNKQILYCLLTNLVAGEEYQEEPYIAAIDLKSAKLTPIVVLKNQRQAKISLSPDGLFLLFDQPVTIVQQATAQSDAPRTASGEAIASSTLWLVPLPSATSEGITAPVQPEQLQNLPGFFPQWLP
jgi:hypothetical protein